MNRENKRKTFEKGYYKTHACSDTFTCKVCGRVCTPQGAGTDHRNHCPNCLSSLHVDIEPGDRESSCGGIMEPISELTRGKTIITIAHRLATIRNADQILVVDDGRIAERGTHAELVQQDGLYKCFTSIRERAEGWRIAAE